VQICKEIRQAVHYRLSDLCKLWELLCVVDRHDATSLHTLEGYDAVDKRKQSVVLAAADVATGVNSGASLTDDDSARSHWLTTSSLDA
jgi:hypothetical protein